ncbi:ACBP-domain-containing protein [Cristinia sonorae]|uniref:ACBP-domain-containing protein n=1 Tax=Cristinia sonorae TaxID=1940300 RepID=A0A8K0XUL3_9AGAR|nr:ACBP-domain-containing protein [Cristinia sonorae]
MESQEMIDAQFDRAVEIVQGLPKTGPIQTGYEEKLTMYSLYKQATVGNVQPPRPSVWDMLARAKWDAWAKHKDLSPQEAKVMYVEALIKVLRKYSEKTVARDLVLELQSYNPGSVDLAKTGSLSRSRSSSSSGSSEGSGINALSGSHYSAGIPEHLQNNQRVAHEKLPLQEQVPLDESASESEDETDDDGNAPLPPASVYSHGQPNRPQSSLSSRRYRTPMASMMMTPPVHSMSVPPTQPMPYYQAPSAFEGTGRSSPSLPSSAYPTTTVSYHGGETSHSSRTDLTSPPNPYPPYRGPTSPPQFGGRPYGLPSGMTPRPASRATELERVLGVIQVNLQALKERLDALESVAHRSTSSLFNSRTSARSGLRGDSPFGARIEGHHFNVDDMGMWSIILSPLSRVMGTFRYLMDFLASGEDRSPTFVIIRRLFLDITFLLAVLACFRLAWRRTGIRRREVIAALGGVWRAILGHKKPRVLVDRAV